MTLSIGKPGNNQTRCRGFTLIELMLILVLLTIVISLVIPSLARFFGGRNLDSEVRRFVSLTRYGQSRAVSEGVPMLLWIDPKAGSYGLQQEAGYTDGDAKAQDFTLSEGLTINVGKSGAKAPAAGKRQGIHFSPDGNIITATSVAGVSIQEGNNPPVWIGPSANGLNYEVQKQNRTLANAGR
jgi:type II secretion system protein H